MNFIQVQSCAQFVMPGLTRHLINIMSAIGALIMTPSYLPYGKGVPDICYANSGMTNELNASYAGRDIHAFRLIAHMTSC